MSCSMHLEIGAPYTNEELYDFWVRFKDDPHSDRILADFMGENGTATAQRIIDDFESRYRLEHCCERD